MEAHVAPAAGSVPLSAGPLALIAESSKPGTIGQRTIDERREDARRGLAYTIVACLAAVVFGSFLLFWTRGAATVDDVVKVIQAVLSPVVGIVGAVTGFYFSSQTAAAAKRNDPLDP